MTEVQFTLFDTAIGRVAIAWGSAPTGIFFFTAALARSMTMTSFVSLFDT